MEKGKITLEKYFGIAENHDNKNDELRNIQLKNEDSLIEIFGENIWNEIPEYYMKEGWLDEFIQLKVETHQVKEIQIREFSSKYHRFKFNHKISVIDNNREDIFDQIAYILLAPAEFIKFNSLSDIEKKRIKLNIDNVDITIQRYKKKNSDYVIIDKQKMNDLSHAQNYVATSANIYNFKKKTSNFGLNAFANLMFVDIDHILEQENKGKFPFFFKRELTHYIFGNSKTREDLFKIRIIEDIDKNITRQINEINSKISLNKKKSLESKRQVETNRAILRIFEKNGFSKELSSESKLRKESDELIQKIGYLQSQIKKISMSSFKENENIEEIPEIKKQKSIIYKLQNQIRLDTQTLEQNKNNLSLYEQKLRHLERMGAQLSSNPHFFSKCPCGNEISNERINLSLKKEICPLCQQKLPKYEEIKKERELNNEEIIKCKNKIDDIKEEIKLTIRSINLKNNWITDRQKKVDILNKSKKQKINLQEEDLVQLISQEKEVNQKLEKISYLIENLDIYNNYYDELKNAEVEQQSFKAEDIRLKNRVFKKKNLHDDLTKRIKNLNEEIEKRFKPREQHLTEILSQKIRHFHQMFNISEEYLKDQIGLDFQTQFNFLLRIDKKKAMIVYFLSLLEMSLEQEFEFPNLIIFKGLNNKDLLDFKEYLEDLNNSNTKLFQIIFLMDFIEEMQKNHWSNFTSSISKINGTIIKN